MTTEIVWRFLVVDDKQADTIEEIVKDDNVLSAPNRVIVQKCQRFDEAIQLLNQLRIDLVILDLNEEQDRVKMLDDIALPGEKIFDEIRQRRFVPIVLYTAFAYKMEDLNHPYVQVVKKGNSRRLKNAIGAVFETGLPQLIRHLEEEQRAYMWKHMESHWEVASSNYEKTDAAFLLARRLGNVLKRSSVEEFLVGQNLVLPREDDSVYPIEMYVYPCVNPKLQVGDILKSKYAKNSSYWMVLTPSCDVEQNKVIDVILAACFPLSDQPEFTKVKELLASKEAITSGAKKDLETLISNNRNAEYKRNDDKKTRFQPERYSFLPGTFFLPDLVVDFQALLPVPIEKIKPKHRVASLDTPFAEACSARFSRYYGRLGTPDINRKFVSTKILEMLQNELEQ